MLRTVVIACLRKAGEVRSNLILGTVLSNEIASPDKIGIAMTETRFTKIYNIAGLIL